MSEEISGSGPSGDSERKPPPETPIQSTIEQRIVALETENNARKDTSISRDFAKEVKRGEWWLITINGLALLASIGIGIVYICQLSEMRKATTATAQTAYAACISAQISRISLIQTESGAEDIHQATLAAMYQGMAAREAERGIIQEIIGDPVFRVGDNVGTPVKLHNAGKTTAYHFTAILRGVLLDRGKEPRFSYPPNMGSTVGGNLGPDEYFPMTPDRVLKVDVRLPGNTIYHPTQKDLDDYLADKKVFFTFGKVSYKDAFGSAHWANFCRYQEKIPEGPIFSSGHGGCVNYNRTDVYSAPPEPSKPIPETAEIKCVKPE